VARWWKNVAFPKICSRISKLKWRPGLKDAWLGSMPVENRGTIQDKILNGF